MSNLERRETNGLRMTEQRRTITTVIDAADDHPHVEEFYARAARADPNISLATVYRRVKLFEESGTLERREFGDGRARYEDAERDHHNHLIDLHSSAVIEFGDPWIGGPAGAHRGAPGLRPQRPPPGTPRRPPRQVRAAPSRRAVNRRTIFPPILRSQENLTISFDFAGLRAKHGAHYQPRKFYMALRPENGTSRLALASLFGALATALHAAPVQIDFSSTIDFDPSAVIGADGQTAELLFTGLYNAEIGASGSAPVTGQFVYESETPAATSNSNVAGYFDAITSASLTFGDSTVTANLAELQAFDATSNIGFNAFANGRWCTTAETCENEGRPFVPESNLIATYNDTSFFVDRQDGNGTVQVDNRDAAFLGLGYTESDRDFAPAITIPGLGNISIQSTSLLPVSTEAAGLLDGIALPDSDSFLFNDQVDFATFGVTFEGDNLDGFAEYNGPVDRLDPSVAAVPLPAALPLFAGTLGALMMVSRRNRLAG